MAKRMHNVVGKAPKVQDGTLLNLSSRLGKRVKKEFLSNVTPCDLSGFPRGWGGLLVKAWKIQDVKKSKGLRLFHGTPCQNIASIIMGGFKFPQHKGMFGTAIYLTPDIGKALGYTGKAKSKSCFVLVCSVDVGRVFTANQALPEMTPAQAKEMGYDSVQGKSGQTASWGGRLIHTEYAVYDPKRIVVTHILQFDPSK